MKELNIKQIYVAFSYMILSDTATQFTINISKGCTVLLISHVHQLRKNLSLIMMNDSCPFR